MRERNCTSVFRVDLLLQLLDLMVHDFEFPFHFCYLILGLNQIFAVQVAIAANCLVEILLLFELCLSFNDLLGVSKRVKRGKEKRELH